MHWKYQTEKKYHNKWSFEDHCATDVQNDIQPAQNCSHTDKTIKSSEANQDLLCTRLL